MPRPLRARAGRSRRRPPPRRGRVSGPGRILLAPLPPAAQLRHARGVGARLDRRRGGARSRRRPRPARGGGTPGAGTRLPPAHARVGPRARGGAPTLPPLRPGGRRFVLPETAYVRIREG